MAFWMTQLPGGGFAMGEAPDEAEARLMIALSFRHHSRRSCTPGRQRILPASLGVG
jgi:hypothetical protein